MEEIEIWKAIPGYEGLYEASNLGRIKTIEKVITNGLCNMKRSEKILRPGRTGKGYLIIVLSKNGKRTTINVHRLILYAFNHVSDLSVDHINAIKDDNRLVNLRYCTFRENTTFHHKKNKSKRTSQFIGVSWNKLHRKWMSQILINGKHKFLGLFRDEKEASNAYEAAKPIFPTI